MMKAKKEQRKINLLVVEDDDVDREKIVRLLGKTRLHLQIFTAETAEAAMHIMHTEHLQCAIVDYRLRDTQGSDLAKSLVAVSGDPFPVIMISGNGDEKLVAKVMREGVYDYLTKRSLTWEILQKTLEKALHWAATEVTSAAMSERLLHLVEGMPQLAWTCLPDGRCDFLNRRWCEYTGAGPDEQLDFGWLQYVHPEDRERMASTWLNVVKVGTDLLIYVRLRRADGEYRWFDTRAIAQRDVSGKIVRWLGSNTDITEFELTRQALADSEQKFHAAFDYAPIGMALVSLDGKILQANATLKKMLGYECQDLNRRQQILEGTSIRQHTAPEDTSFEQEKLRELRRLKLDSIQFEKSFLKRDNSLVHTMTSVAVLRPTNSSPCYLYQAYDLSERKRYEAKLIQLANQDPLTGLGNRAKLQEELEAAIHNAKRLGTQFAVFFIDLDNFKQINDSLGHEAGDQLLKVVALRLQKCLRKFDSVTRLGGDEFVVVLQDINKLDAVAKVAELLLLKIKAPIQLEAARVHIAMSLGMALYPSHGDDAKTLLRNADTALYDAKSRGRGCYQVYRAEMTHSANSRLILDSDLRNAIAQQQFEVYYQPVVNLVSGKIECVEALLRWNHPQRGLVLPDDFIPYAQECGLICQIGDWVLNEACQKAVDWNAKGFDVAVSVNVSVRQFHEKNLKQVVERALSLSRLPANKLILEITEQMFLEDTENNLDQVCALKAKGIRMSLDDFGTGYSSLSYIIRFAPDFIKIDRSFVYRIGEAKEHDEMVAAIVGLSKVIPMKIVAEGVETHKQQGFLQGHHCDFVQGFYYSHPVPIEPLMKVLQQDQACARSMH